MDRLSVVSAVALALAAACDDGRAASSSPSRERVNAVKAAPAAAADPAAMCDHYPARAQARPLAWPALTGSAPAPRAGAWRWINVWATWCKPCVEELPRIVTWQRRLAAAGIDVDLTLVSADESDADVAAFRDAHPGTPTGLRLANPDDAAAWIASLGVKGATLPVHVMVDPAGAVRCVRASAVEDPDFAAVRALLSQR